MTTELGWAFKVGYSSNAKYVSPEFNGVFETNLHEVLHDIRYFRCLRNHPFAVAVG